MSQNKTQEENKSLPIDEKKWEVFCDSSYYDMWAVRPVGDGDFGSQRLFHVSCKQEAEHLKEVMEEYCNLPNEPSIQEDGWVDVKNHLPNKNEEVNIYFKNSAGYHVASTFWDGNNFIELCERCGFNKPFSYSDAIVTHWQSLPLPPNTQPQPLQELCHCTPDQTTGHTGGKCNVCGKEQEDGLDEAAKLYAEKIEWDIFPNHAAETFKAGYNYYKQQLNK